ncbi:phosphatidylinositol-specific phospholipase C domain-containing protein [Allonocardiopsis opalescens]|uniref:Calcium-dependent phosphoinositide phospholipase C n=1 Tax=Allonocardiopsis opalescens TaxID=1144618 RepID=A0A2T0PU48_9ACTN|nr:phosphatidylinositol-specific phospholipase C domain-containing protein [Allonocardiopsis opalescens]PRX92246.1 calcium-dependent phosphoinositide phospholipase C [Allonocardiopsis opalescens]
MPRPLPATAAALAGAAALTLATAAVPAQAAAASMAQTTTVGVHNAYEQATFGHFADALDSGAALLEIDVWTHGLTGRWRVSHDLNFANDNNCSGEGLYGPRDQDLGACLRNVREWHDANPGHRPIVLKVEFKNGFDNSRGMGPDEFDALVRDTLGDALLRPAEVAGGHPNLDAAVRAGAWPDREALRGRVLIEIIPGTFERGNPFDSYWTDEEYGDHLVARAAAGDLGSATSFPAVLGAAAGDPRTRLPESVRPWFVVFDGDAAAYLGGIDTDWYRDNGYLLIMTGAASVAPAIPGAQPDPATATERVRLLAAAGASIVTADWTGPREVLELVEPRG